jgi:hypothetical protein
MADFYERCSGAFWPYLLLVAVLVAVSYAWFQAGRAAQADFDKPAMVAHHSR